jgi:hypothetical protein
MANLKNLQHAASEAAGKGPPKKRSADSSPVVAVSTSTPARSKSRAGKIALTFHLPEDFKRSLRLVQAQRGHGCTLEQLAAEALNDLFGKHNVPTVVTDNC